MSIMQISDNNINQISNKMSLKTAAAFEKMVPFLKESGAETVKKVGFVYHFEISPAKGKPATVWTVDLKNGSGSIK
jgi:hypothetical protein